MNGIASVVVAINPHDEPFRPMLDGWAAQADAGDYEVIVVDNGARPGVREAYAAHRDAFPASPVRRIEVDVVGRAASNNAGVRESRGDLVVFVADDFRPGRTLVAAHRRFHALATTPAVGVGPGYFGSDHRDDPFLRWMEDSGMIYGIAFPLAAIEWRPGFVFVGNASMARATYEAVGAFDERFKHDLFDDFEWSMRLRDRGIPTRYVPRAFAWHDHDVTLPYRLESTRRLGEAVRIYETGWQGPRPWGGLTDLAVEPIEAELAAERAKGDVAGTIGERAKRWQLEMTLAFLHGYRSS